MEERSTFQFFRSFYDAAKNIPDKAMQADFLMAICEYALNGKEPEGSGIINALFALVKPNLDISRKRAQAGRKGGEANDSKHEAESNHEEANKSKVEANKSKVKANESKVEANKSKVEANKSKVEANESKVEANESKVEANESKMQNPTSDGEGDKGRGIKEVEEEYIITSPTSPDGEVSPHHADNREKIPYAAIRDAYNEICQSFPKCNALSDKRKGAIRARIHSGGYTFADFQRLFRKAEASAFLRGENKKNWRATFDWLLADANMAKVLDGNYDDNRSTIPGNRSARVSNAPAPGPCSPVTAADVDRSWAEMERMQRELGGQ